MQEIGVLHAIWRYPVKSLAAQPLAQTPVHPEGLPGDRAAALFVEQGHARVGKAYRGKEHNLLHTVTQAQAGVDLAANRGVDVAVRAEPGERYFDAAPISLIFDTWIAQLERALGTQLDPLRWRPNFYAKAAPDFAMDEPELVDRIIEIGEVVLRVRKTIERCVTPNYDIATGEPNHEVLRYVAQHRNTVLGVYCEVELAGTVRVGDPLRLRAR